MTVKRDARGTLRDYKRELERKFFPVLSSFSNCFEIFRMAFSSVPLVEPNSNFPWRSFASFNEANATHLAPTVSTAESLRVMTIFFWGDKAQVSPTVIESISIDMINKCPTIRGFANDVVMDKIFFKSSVSVVTFIEFYPHELFVIDIFVENRVPYEIMSHIVHRGLDYISINNGISEDSLSIDWHERGLATGFLPIIMKAAQSFSEMRAVTSWDIAYHTNIITKNNKISNIRSANG